MVRVGASVAGSVHGVAYWDMPERLLDKAPCGGDFH